MMCVCVCLSLKRCVICLLVSHAKGTCNTTVPNSHEDRLKVRIPVLFIDDLRHAGNVMVMFILYVLYKKSTFSQKYTLLIFAFLYFVYDKEEHGGKEKKEQFKFKQLQRKIPPTLYVLFCVSAVPQLVFVGIFFFYSKCSSVIKKQWLTCG